MKTFIMSISAMVLSGCAYLGSKDYGQYVEVTKSISRDNTVAQTACWSAIAEIAKGGDIDAKKQALALTENCKNQPVVPVPPQRNWLGF